MRTESPDAVPVQSAASVLVLAERPELEVLLLHRRAGSAFVGGMVVFPGGAVDDADRSDASRRLVDGDIAAATKEAGGEIAHLVAVARETLEETGLWLGTDPAGPLAARREIDSGRTRLAEVALAGSLRAGALPHAGRWVTPVGAPRRYDAHFFVARADRSAQDLDALSPDGREVVGLEWTRPGDALRRLEAGDLTAMEPTVAYLEALIGYETVDSVIETARRGRRFEQLYAWTTI